MDHVAREHLFKGAVNLLLMYYGSHDHHAHRNDSHADTPQDTGVKPWFY